MANSLQAASIALCLVVAPAIAAESVELSSKTKWTCKDDTKVHLDDETGKLRIISKAAKTDQTLPFHACHSSHCDWGTGPGAGECQEAPCAEMLASEREQSLMIKLIGFERSCTAKKQ